MKTLSLDIRTRILACYDERKHTRDAVAKRFCVSLGMVKKLLRQRKATGEIGVLYHRAGQKPETRTRKPETRNRKPETPTDVKIWYSGAICKKENAYARSKKTC
jgi:transposase